MKRARFDKLDTGWNADLPDVDLPPGAWTDSRNVKYRDGALEKCPGYSQALGNLSVTATWAMGLSDQINSFWAYGSASVMYATDGTTHTTINGTVTLSATDGYVGGAFNGFMVVTEGANAPYSWAPSLANDLATLTAWPAITCEVIRPWRDFLVALRIREGGNLNPRRMRWSDAAQKGALPGSWDYADPTNQSGIKEFGETQDALIDCAPLRDSLIVYKQNVTWVADYVGGADVLGFRQLFGQSGALTQDCIGVLPTGHVVLTNDDLILHDGNSQQSLIDRRARRWLFNRIDTTNYKKSFVAVDPRRREVIIAFPEQGLTECSLALVWSWADNTLHPIDLGGKIACAAAGMLPGTATTFDADASSFNVATDAFDTENISPFKQNVLLFDALSPKAYQVGVGETFNGTSMACYAERRGHALTEDMGAIKRLWRLWPKLIGTVGDTFDFWISVRENLLAPLAYVGPYRFTLGTDTWIDLRIDGRIVDVRVQYEGAQSFRFHGFHVDYEDSGTR
jgi:hypothetical protein